MFHFRGAVDKWPGAVSALPNGCSVKAVMRPDILRDARIYKPGIPTILRHWNDHYTWTTDWEYAKILARAWFDSFIDGTFIAQYVQHVMAVSERNEYDSHTLDPQERAKRILWMQAVAWVWTNEYRNQLQQFRPGLPPIDLILADNAVGNDLPVEAAILALDNDIILGYHPYIAVFSPTRELVPNEVYVGPEFHAHKGLYQVTDENGFAPLHPDRFSSAVPGERSPEDWRWLSGRWHYMEQMWGAKPRWAFTEAGPVQDLTGTFVLNPLGGWRTIWGYSPWAIEQYIGMLKQWLVDVKQTSAYQEGRIYGFHLFNTGGSGWDGFKTEQPEMQQIAVMLQSEWNPGTPAPGPSMVNGLDVSRYQGNINWPTAKSRGAEFVFAKATEHTTWVDPMFSQYIAGAKAAGIITGAYHFYRPNYDPLDQAAHFVNTTFSADVDMPLVLDVEIPPGLTFGSVGDDTESLEDDHGHMGVSKDISGFGELVDKEALVYFPEEVRACLMRIKSLTGKRPILYTSPGFYSSYLASGDFNEVADLWIAHWTTAPQPTIPSDYSTWHFWQWTSNGNGAEWGASSARIDLDRFNGTLEQLKEYYMDDVIVPECVLSAAKLVSPIAVHSSFAIARRILNDGRFIVSSERGVDAEGKTYRFQYAQGTGGDLWLYVTWAPDWDKNMQVFQL